MIIARFQYSIQSFEKNTSDRWMGGWEDVAVVVIVVIIGWCYAAGGGGDEECGRPGHWKCEKSHNKNKLCTLILAHAIKKASDYILARC